MSPTRESTVSVKPPKKPASAPKKTPIVVVRMITRKPTDSDVDAPCTMREYTSQPCLVKPSGCPAVGPLLLNCSSQWAGSTDAKRPGNSATKTMNAISAPEIQNIGRVRTSRHASSQRLLGLLSILTVSMAEIGVSSTGAT